MKPQIVRSPPLLCATLFLGCVPMTGSTGGSPPCAVSDGTVEQAIYVPPLALELQVPTEDGGILLCMPGSGEECERLLDESCTAAFGAVSVGDSAEIGIGLHNISSSETLAVQSVSFSADSDPAFELLDAAPTEVGPDETVIVRVGFSPMGAGEHAAELVVASDAVNAEGGATDVAIVATAVE